MACAGRGAIRIDIRNMAGAKNSRKGILFSMDAMLALAILATGIMYLNSIYSYQQESAQAMTYVFDAVEFFSKVKLGNLDNEYIDYLVSIGELSEDDMDKTLVEQAYYFSLNGKDEFAEELVKNVSTEIIGPQYGFEFLIADNKIYSNGKEIRKSLFAYKGIVSTLSFNLVPPNFKYEQYEVRVWQ